MVIAHRRHGSGPRTVFCLHGWFGSADGWGDLYRHLDTDANTYVFVDYRGYGARKDEAGEYTLAEISADVRVLADELGVQTYSLFGHSMGGAAIQRVYADAPERVEAIIGLSPVGAVPTPLDEGAHDLFYGAPEDPARRAGIIDFTTGNRLPQRWIDGVVRESQERSTPASVAGHLRAWAEADFAADVEAAQKKAGREIPVVVIVGAHDPALGEQTMRGTWVVLWPQATVEVLADAGHYGTDEEPVRLAGLVDGFLAENR